MTEHPRIRDLEACAVGEATPELAAHVDGCIACRGHLAKLEHERQALLDRLPPARFVAGVAARRAASERRTRRRRLVVASGLGLAAAAAVVLVLPPPAPATGARLKGVGVEIFRKRGGVVEPLGAAGRVRAGDGLRVSLTLPAPQHASIWFVDAHGRVDPYPGGERELAAGPNLLPGVTVDAPCVDMTLVVALPGGRFEQVVSCE